MDIWADRRDFLQKAQAVQQDSARTLTCLLMDVTPPPVMGDVNWVVVVSASLLAGVLSLLTSVAGLPEVENKRE